MWMARQLRRVLVVAEVEMTKFEQAVQEVMVLAAKLKSARTAFTDAEKEYEHAHLERMRLHTVMRDCEAALAQAERDFMSHVYDLMEDAEASSL
jgi:hypothetical protein